MTKQKELNIAQLNKVYPRINAHDYKVNKYYIYAYLNPFSIKKKTYVIDDIDITFEFEPIYIGKATGKGFRHNQHIAEYLKKTKDDNAFKFGEKVSTINHRKAEAFQSLERKFEHVKSRPKDFDAMMPQSWKDYQKDWVIIIKEYDNSEELIKGEATIIKNIGTLLKGTGPLTNLLLG